jgi:hypothetical protein
MNTIVFKYPKKHIVKELYEKEIYREWGNSHTV